MEEWIFSVTSKISTLHSNNMATVAFGKSYKKRIKPGRIPKDILEKAKEVTRRFIENPHDSDLRLHSLLADYDGYQSIDVTGDWRIILRDLGEDRYLFVEIGTHSYLYGK